jgi:hypothetical protein
MRLSGEGATDDAEYARLGPAASRKQRELAAEALEACLHKERLR